MAEVSAEPWWWTDAPPRDIDPSDVGECDVAIVGAGFTGLTAALTLARAGKSVQVFEKDRPGEGASSRNGGITSGSLRYGVGDAVRAFGNERGRGIHLEAVEARQFLRDLIQESGIECDYALTGLFTGALTAQDFEALKGGAAALEQATGVAPRIIEGQELASYTGSGRYVGGVLRSDIGTIHPAKLVAGLLDAALGQGAQVHANTPVQRLERAGAGYRLHTSRGVCRAGQVIWATNGYTDAAFPWLRRRLVPVRSRIVVTEELPSNLIAALIPDRRAMGDMRKLHYYYRPTPDGKRILFGGREPAWGGSTDQAIAHVRKGLIDIFPVLEDYRISYSWAGNVAFNIPQLPFMAQHDGIHIAGGYCGSGTVWAPWFGHKTAAKILGRPDAASFFDSSAPPGIPLYAGRPWFLPFMMTGYRFADWMQGR